LQTFGHKKTGAEAGSFVEDSIINLRVTYFGIKQPINEQHRAVPPSISPSPTAVSGAVPVTDDTSVHSAEVSAIRTHD
jgi:hypothetical protein